MAYTDFDTRNTQRMSQLKAEIMGGAIAYDSLPNSYASLAQTTKAMSQIEFAKEFIADGWPQTEAVHKPCAANPDHSPENPGLSMEALRNVIAQQNEAMEAQARTIAKLRATYQQQCDHITKQANQIAEIKHENGITYKFLMATIKRQEAIIAKLMPATTVTEKARRADCDKHEPLHRAMDMLYGETNGWKP